jgi:hypothetical protein
MIHTAKTVREDFSDVVEIARRLPPALPKMPQTFWPDIVRNSSELYAAEGQRTRRAVSAEEMKRYETVASWITFVDEEYVRRAVWMVASGVPAWKIEKLLLPSVRVSASTVNRKVSAGFALIAEKLNAHQTPPIPVLTR